MGLACIRTRRGQVVGTSTNTACHPLCELHGSIITGNNGSQVLDELQRDYMS